jgi:hypothetical protein
MEVIDALAIEGGRGYGVLCYGIFNLSDLEEGFESAGVISSGNDGVVYKLYSEGWGRGVILYELELKEASDVPARASIMLDQMMGIGSCVAAFCMFDGAFYSYNDVFSEDVADQIYAFSFGLGKSVVNMDRDFLQSRGWLEVIEGCRRRVFS